MFKASTITVFSLLHKRFMLTPWSFFKIAIVSFKISISSSISCIFAFNSSISLDEAGRLLLVFLWLFLWAASSAQTHLSGYIFSANYICLQYYIPILLQLFAQSRQVQSSDARLLALFRLAVDADVPKCCIHKKVERSSGDLRFWFIQYYIVSDGVQDSQEALLYVSPIESLHILQEHDDTVLLNTSFSTPSDVAYPVQLFVRTPDTLQVFYPT